MIAPLVGRPGLRLETTPTHKHPRRWFRRREALCSGTPIRCRQASPAMPFRAYRGIDTRSERDLVTGRPNYMIANVDQENKRIFTQPGFCLRVRHSGVALAHLSHEQKVDVASVT